MIRRFFLICLCILSFGFCAVGYTYVFEVYDASDGMIPGLPYRI